jgi:two-component system, cell cycle response regulator DivK
MVNQCAPPRAVAGYVLMISPLVRPLVLIVEDDQDTRDMYALYLTLSGMGVVTASSVDAAFALALEKQPDIILTDFMLTGTGSGADLCHRLHQDERTRHIPALLLTGSSRKADADAALAAGCADVRVKPYLPDALLNDIRDLISRPASHS